jgi:hypothetical protein
MTGWRKKQIKNLQYGGLMLKIRQRINRVLIRLVVWFYKK